MKELSMLGNSRFGRPAALAILCCISASAMADPASIAVFDFSLVNTSPAASTPAEMARLQRMSNDLRDMLAASGRYVPVDLGPVRDKLRDEPAIKDCNGCERDLARTLDAEFAAYGWVQKVSNLILNVNLVIEDAKTGRVIKAGSVDIRGNTDESWSRGLKYLLRERILDTAP